MTYVQGIALFAVVTAVTCAVPGVFVILRKSSMLVDGISHAILPGIVLGYYFTHDLNSPLLVLGATLAGVVVVLGAEYLSRIGLLAGDAPQGLIFPALFAGGVIMVTLNFANVHLDTHAVLVGDLNLAGAHTWKINGFSIGPSYMYMLLAVWLVNLAFLIIFYPQLKITTFDNDYAQTLGIRTGWLNSAFMFLVSFTVTAAFNAAGAILIIALMIIPAATAYLLTNRLPVLIGLAMLIAAVGAFVGFWISYWVNAATSAGLAVFYGLIFAVAFAVTQVRQKLHHRRSHRSIVADDKERAELRAEQADKAHKLEKDEVATASV